jgi:hypothetical protein
VGAVLVAYGSSSSRRGSSRRGRRRRRRRSRSRRRRRRSRRSSRRSETFNGKSVQYLRRALDVGVVVLIGHRHALRHRNRRCQMDDVVDFDVELFELSELVYHLDVAVKRRGIAVMVMTVRLVVVNQHVVALQNQLLHHVAADEAQAACAGDEQYKDG